MNRSDQPIEALLDEERLFPPPQECSQNANIADPDIYQRAAKDPEAYWAQAAESLEWIRKWDRVLDWNPPIAQWFIGGKINVSVNCLDRHVRGWRRNKAAFIWEGEPGEERVLTFADLYREVNRFANAMKRLGVKKGDRVTVYMPMIPEPAPVALLACARIGAPPQRGLRRIQRRVPAGPDQRRSIQAGDHCRRELPPRADRPSQAKRGRGPRGLPLRGRRW